MRRVFGSALLVVFATACGDSGSNPDGGGSDATTDGTTKNDANVGDGGDASTIDVGDSVLMRSNHLNRDALYIQPTFTTAGIATMKLDSGFAGTVSGNVYAGVLYFKDGPGGKGIVIAATENNQVTALDANTGAVVWQKTLGATAAKSGAGCGNIAPLGVTGTPAIDPVSRSIFMSAAIGDANGITEHEIHALSLDDGSERPNFPAKASTANYQATKFDPPLHNQRSGILFLNGVIYVGYGGHAGDCGQYHGWLIGVPYNNPSQITAYAASIAANTRAAGIWGVGGPASDGKDIFLSTGNTFGASTWVGQEAVLRLQPGPVFSNQSADYWAPHNFITLDNGDTDIGGSAPMLVDVAGATPSKLAVALGKNGFIYLIDRASLGGVGASAAADGVSNVKVNSGEIINAGASVTTSTGTWVILHGYAGGGVGCVAGSGNLVATKISAAAPPVATVPWCANSNATSGSPMITTSDGSNDAIVWEVGTKLNGWNVNTGAQVYTGADTVANVDLGGGGTRHMSSPIAANGHIYVGGDDKIYAFKP